LDNPGEIRARYSKSEATSGIEIFIDLGKFIGISLYYRDEDLTAVDVIAISVRGDIIRDTELT
jgi:hypothetical protein